VHLDFFSGTNWSALEAAPHALIAGGLLIAGLLVIAAPAFASHALFENDDESVDLTGFITETALSWISVIMIYRLFGNIHESVWLEVIGYAASAMVLASLIVIPFQTLKTGAIYLWLASLPVMTLMILPLIPARDAFLFIVGSIAGFCGLWVAFDRSKKTIDKVGSAFFFLGSLGCIGWSTSAGMLTFFSRAESQPFLVGGIYFLLLVFGTFGWRILLNAGGDSSRGLPSVKWSALAIFFFIGFGPVVSGRWSGGAFPLDTDWIEGAKAWPWVRSTGPESTEVSWLGFGIGQSIPLLSILFGSVLWRGKELFPFAKRFPRGSRSAQGLFGLLRMSEITTQGFKATGQFFSREFSDRLWERVVPVTVEMVFGAFRRFGTASEKVTDYFTREKYGRLFISPAKLVQWFHGGNVRLYAWFALIWVFIFALYLNR
jgi:hypothetical protein